MIDEIVAEAKRGHQKKIVWQEEQEKGDYLTPYKSSKSPFIPLDSVDSKKDRVGDV